ncbi:DUF1990 family protein [Pyxidicoccus fallax]|uniref:DUF1990 family protein n=1 Tax=Pyxidicoccus fallax TaxID=394095 RepID=A0A848LKQ6_9BACT|nr:DUF1990 family protein [Pyxidicoccus fallax]NMO18367.1 DUF1990 family protein [Pyxidicoccus fallax]NPC83381.1 DUF1990 family protein [Pyxidicoccus fallax]
MIEWRWFSSWKEEELVPRLERARALRRNFEAGDGEMTMDAGWSQVHSVGVLGHEPPGPPRPDGIFERSRKVLETFDFSDPRIVRWHFSAEEPLKGRTVLLELKSLDQKLRYLCAVRVGGTRLEHGEKCSVYGFSFETLQGHIECGREWFLLKKDHESGEVKFHIEAAWRPGEFPNWWSRLGFTMVGRRYQRAWHRLTHVRLRELTRRRPDLVGQPARRGRLAHSGHELELGPVQFYSQRATGQRKTQVDEEVEAVNRGFILTPLGLGVLAGMRSMSAPTLVSQRLSKEPGPKRDPLSEALAKPWVPKVLGALALGELIVDKLPKTPARVKFAPMAGRVFTGVLAAVSSVAGQKKSVVALAGVLGGAAAVASAWAFYSLRTVATKRFRVPNVAAAFAEDALVAAIGSRLMPVVETRA